LVFRAGKLRDDAVQTAASSDTAELSSAVAMLHRADSLLVGAERADRRWTAPVIDRGRVALELAHRQSGPDRVAAFDSAVAHANRALAQNSRNADGLELRGTARYWKAARLGLTDPEFAELLAQAQADLETAVALDSSLATARGTLSLVRVARGKVSEAEHEAQAALAADTYLRDAPTILLALYGANLVKGTMGDAAKWCEQGARDYPRDPRFLECQITLLAEDASRVANPRLAWTFVTRAAELDPPARARAAGRAYLPVYRMVMAAVVSARAGDVDSARAVMRRARALADVDPSIRTDLTYEEAYLHLVLGERAEAIRLLSEYVAARPTLRDLVGRHARWAPLASDSAFRRLVAGSRPDPK